MKKNLTPKQINEVINEFVKHIGISSSSAWAYARQRTVEAMTGIDIPYYYGDKIKEEFILK